MWKFLVVIALAVFGLGAWVGNGFEPVVLRVPIAVAGASILASFAVLGIAQLILPSLAETREAARSTCQEAQAYLYASIFLSWLVAFIVGIVFSVKPTIIIMSVLHVGVLVASCLRIAFPPKHRYKSSRIG